MRGRDEDVKEGGRRWGKEGAKTTMGTQKKIRRP